MYTAMHPYTNESIQTALRPTTQATPNNIWPKLNQLVYMITLIGTLTGDYASGSCPTTKLIYQPMLLLKSSILPIKRLLLTTALHILGYRD